MSVNIGQIAATTQRNREAETVDNVSNHNALLRHLRETGKWESVSGGRTLVSPISYAENGTVKFYDGGQESFSIPTEEVIDAAEYDWKFLGGFIYFTEAERIKNRGKEQAVALMEAKLKNLKDSIANTTSTSLYSDGTGTGGKELGGLQLIVDDDPTAAGTVGGIDQNAQTFWRNYYSAAASTTSSNIQSRMKAAWLAIQRGTDTPDLIVADDAMFTYYWDSLSANQRFTSPSGADAIWQDGIKFQKAKVVYDDACVNKHMYFLNCDHLQFKYASVRLFSTGDNRTVTNANYDVVPVFFAGNLTCSRRASQGVIIAS